MSGRAVVSKARKLALVARACAPDWAHRAAGDEEGLGEVAFLIEAVRAEPVRGIEANAAEPAFVRPFRDFRRRTVGVIDLFERVRAREAETGRAPGPRLLARP